MAFPSQRVLLVGATAGIGAAMADKLIREGSRVIAVGRRQDRLDAFVRRHGPDRASAIRFDVTDRAGLDAFVHRVVADYPDLDCVFLNAGTQSAIRLSRPADVDLDAFHREMDTNFGSMVNLSLKFLPHLLAKKSPTALVVTGTHLSLVPAVAMPAYSSSKAALKAYFDCLRRQNRGSNVKFIEILPPIVQTELHDYMGEERGRAMGMPVDEFVDKTYARLAAGDEEFTIGQLAATTPEAFDSLLKSRRAMLEGLSDVILERFEL